MKVERVGKIAVLRANAIGDFIFCLPALEALRAAYPEAEIVLLGQRWHAHFLTGRPGPFDRVIAVPPSQGVYESVKEKTVEDPVALELFFHEMTAERFDLAIQMHGGGHYSNPFLLRLGARLTAGLKAPDAPPLDRWVPYIYFQPEVLRYLEVVALVGARPVTLEPRLQITERDQAEAAGLVPSTGQPLVALHPGTGSVERRWPAAKFAAVGDALAATGAHVVVTGIAEERHLVQGVIQAMDAPAQDLCGQISLGGAAGLYARCAVVVSNDSGPLHLAEAVGAATVGIYWCGNLLTAGPVSRARHRSGVSWRLTCPQCGANCIEAPCGHRVSFVEDVPVEEVVGQALELLGSESAMERIGDGAMERLSG